MASSLNSQMVLVLGGGGYIGSHFQKAYPSKNFVFVGHSDIKSMQSEFYTKVKTVLNLSASKLHASKEESRSANFDFPVEILQQFSNHPIKWVQVASYYELQVPHGRSDYYSLDKTDFRNFLIEMAEIKRDLTVTTLFLPHIFGGNEAESRIIPTLKKMNNGAEVFLGSENQLIPLLHVRDAVRALHQSLLTEQKICTPRPMWHGQLRDLVLILTKPSTSISRVHFTDTLDKHQECALEYPDLLEHFSPTLSFEQFVESFRNGDLE